jgi:orotidine-5'-phosphate decarboxylase
MNHFVSAVLERPSVVCFGLDPVYEEIPAVYRDDPNHPEKSLSRWCLNLIEACHERVACFKINSAYFEAIGAAGFAVMAGLFQVLDRLQVPAIWDCKRGDVPHSLERYTRAALMLKAGAVTCNPWLGIGEYSHMVADPDGLALFPVVRASNAGAAFLQDALVYASSEPGTLQATNCMPAYRLLAHELHKINLPTVALGSYGRLGAVVGATVPAQLQIVRGEMPYSLLLVPGLGMQGGQMDALRPVFDVHGRGLLVNVSRGLVQGARNARDVYVMLDKYNHDLDALRSKPC